jgi:hypothetical protein
VLSEFLKVWDLVQEVVLQPELRCQTTAASSSNVLLFAVLILEQVLDSR